MYKITTVMGLPGSGKSTLCREKAYRGTGAGPGTWRPEPTEDIEELKKKFSFSQVQHIILQRFINLDTQVLPSQYRDSDIWTSYYIFGNANMNIELMVPKISDTLIYLKISPELQKERILKRNRSMALSELQFCKEEWHQKAERAFQLHPAKHKEIIEFF